MQQTIRHLSGIAQPERGQINRFMSNASMWARVLGVVTGTVITGGGAWTVYNLAATTQESQTRKGVQGQEQPRDEGAGLNIPRGWLASERLRDALIGTAAVSGCLGVACGAYGFHGLRSRLVRSMTAAEADRLVRFWEIAKSYQLWHSIALMGTAALPLECAVPSGLLFASGIALFSGGIFGYVLTGSQFFQYLTPFGGMSLMGAWGVIAIWHITKASRSAS